MENKIINTPNAPAPIGPYSQAVLAGNTLYVSGQIAINPKTNEMVNSTIYEETKQVLDNLKAVVEAAGLQLKDVVKCSIFISNMDDFKNINEVYSTYFNESKPARETVEVARLPKNVNVEISCVAVK